MLSFSVSAFVNKKHRSFTDKNERIKQIFSILQHFIDKISIPSYQTKFFFFSRKCAGFPIEKKKKMSKNKTKKKIKKILLFFFFKN